MAAAAYLLQTGTVFTVATGAFSTLVYNVISGEVTIDNAFYDSRVWGNTSSGKSDGRARYQAMGSVRAWHDSAVTTPIDILTNFAPLFPALGSATGLSAIAMTFTAGKGLTCNAHIYDYHLVGDRQKDSPVEVTFGFRSVGTIGTLTL